MRIGAVKDAVFKLFPIKTVVEVRKKNIDYFARIFYKVGSNQKVCWTLGIEAQYKKRVRNIAIAYYLLRSTMPKAFVNPIPGK